VLDNVRQCVDNAGDDRLIVGERKPLKAMILMRVTRIAERKYQRTDIEPLHDGEDIGKRHVVIVRAFVITPTDMGADAIPRNIGDGAIDRVDYLLDEFEKRRNRPILERSVPLHREIGAIEL
jgi:hypothetical protein